MRVLKFEGRNFDNNGFDGGSSKQWEVQILKNSLHLSVFHGILKYVRKKLLGSPLFIRHTFDSALKDFFWDVLET